MTFYRGPVSDHFDGRKFFNPWGGLPGGGSLFKWFANRRPGPWRNWIDDPPAPPPPRWVTDGEIRATFVGHSTVLIQMDGLNVLCDPIWSNRASPFSVDWAVGGIGRRAFVSMSFRRSIWFFRVTTITIISMFRHCSELLRVGRRFLRCRSVLRARVTSKRIAPDDRIRRTGLVAIGGTSHRCASPQFQPGIFQGEVFAIVARRCGAAT